MSEAHDHPNYEKIWYWLLILLAISVAGPMLEIPWITVLTAFGIALIKTFMVAANFMHLKFEKKIIWYLLIIAIIFLGIFYFGVAADIMNILLPSNRILPSPPILSLIICPHNNKFFIKFKKHPKKWVEYKCKKRVIKYRNVFYLYFCNLIH